MSSKCTVDVYILQVQHYPLSIAIAEPNSQTLVVSLFRLGLRGYFNPVRDIVTVNIEFAFFERKALVLFSQILVVSVISIKSEQTKQGQEKKDRKCSQ